MADLGSKITAEPGESLTGGRSAELRRLHIAALARLPEERRKHTTETIAKHYQFPRDPLALDAAFAAATAVPFRDSRLMDNTPPSCTAADFKTPRLRKCPFVLSTIDWRASSRLDGGLDGYAWKVWFNKDRPYVLKVVRRRIVPSGRRCSFTDSTCLLSFGTQSRQHLVNTLPHSENAKTLPCSR